MTTDPDMYKPDPHGWDYNPKPWHPRTHSEQPQPAEEDTPAGAAEPDQPQQVASDG